ncbi:hypothetical protein AALB16_12370 [Lachnospiraceae bacterium 62-35]
MNKKLVGILTAAMVLTIGTAHAFAAVPGAGRNFVDADGDGVCDYFGSVCSYVDMDSDGICDNCNVYHRNSMAQAGHGRYFVDADGDGVCDYFANGCARGNGLRGKCNR